jgi:hypothetical protein
MPCRNRRRTFAGVDLAHSMQTPARRVQRGVTLLLTAAMLALAAAPALAARIGVLSNKYASETAKDFASHIAQHTFTGIDVGGGPPPLDQLLAQFDAILLFEDGTYVQAPLVGNAVAAYARSGRAVVLGTFYDQERSDGSPDFTPHGWGDLETIDPNTTDGMGTSYAQRTLGGVITHPLTVGIKTLSAVKYAGGNQAKAGTVVVATWAQKNARGLPDPAIDYRVTGPACVIHVAIAPDYPTVATSSSDFGGDFYRAWSNAFDFAAIGCQGVIPGDFGQIAQGFANRGVLDAWRAAFPFAVTLDGAPLQGGFGPALQLVTLSGGRIVAGP